MGSALLIGVVIAAALVCPMMAWLGRRGIGPGCTLGGRRSPEGEETLENLRGRQRVLAKRIARIEADPGRETTGSVKRT